MTELEMMRWILGIQITAGALAVAVMYFLRNDVAPALETDGGAYGAGNDRGSLQLALISSSKNAESTIPSSILESDVYEAIQQSIRQCSIMIESSPIWDELEKTVLQSCPKFKSNMYVLAGGDLKQSDLQMALLIKCGVSPANIATLVGRSKSTITFRRKDMGRKLFDREMDANSVDRLIRLI